MHRFAFVCLCSLLVCCVIARAADRSADTAKWQGTWKIVSVNGQPMPAKMQWVVEGDHYNVRMDGKSMEKWNITIDAGKKHVDAFHHDTPKGTYGGKLKGIYEIKGDSLKVCYDMTGQQYPKSFEAGPGLPQVTYEFKRERK
jgi:uncharacterized protein (TIGR03067 family)